MKTRPALKPGDVCKLHKKHLNRYRRFDNTAYIVQSIVSGDGIEGDSAISVVAVTHRRYYKHGKLFEKLLVRRRKLWFTGHNINDKAVNKVVAKVSSWAKTAATALAQPRTDEEQCTCGRMKDRGKKCWWCGFGTNEIAETINCWCGSVKYKGQACPTCGVK